MNQKEEKLLRNNIRHLLQHVKQKRIDEEKDLRDIIRQFADFEMTTMTERQTADNSPTPNKSTGINVLEDLLKKIIPVLETDYKLLTTDAEQRQSFRSHVINAVINTLAPVEANTDAVQTSGEEELEIDVYEEEIDVDVSDTNDEKFIDIRTDAEKNADDEGDEEDPVDTFAGEVEGDETGRNVAYATFKKIDTSIIDSYELLSNPEDQELYYDYLIANLKLYFDKFEEELAAAVEEPTNQAYDMAKSEEEASVEGADEIALQEYINSL